ncbi:MAG: radical SAM protein [Labilithrix sp.]|nr:radical SAM protein [Labilithrix sp.]MCW5816032.1 radical SAM protein [Labilithrix sp.]
MSWPSPPEPAEGVVCWNVNTTCNYRCTYCTQRFKDDRGRWSRDTPRFLDAFRRLPGRWEVKLSGGEPFVHPTLLEIVAGVAAAGHRVSVVTNLSASPERLDAFVAAARGRVGTFSCSLHLEYVDDVERFADKAARLGETLRARADASLPRPHVCVTTVATRAALPRLDALAALFRARGLTFKVQPERDDGVIAAYSAEERALLEALGGHNATGAIAHDFAGRPCWAGARFFVLDDKGDAYRCYPGRRATLTTLRARRGIPDLARERALGRLGSFLDPDFRLEPEATPCRYRLCYCTVPIARAMMAGAPVTATEAS